MEKPKSVKVKCAGCKRGLTAESTTLKEMRVTRQGKQYRLLYLECQECKSKTFVQVDSGETLRLLSLLEDHLVKGNVRMAGIVNKRLDRKRKELHDALNRKMVHDVDEPSETTCFILRLAL